MSISSLLFTDYRRRVLGLLLLHPEQRYHLREIARLTGTAPGTLTRELSKLAEAGLLTREKVGSQLQFSANQQCLIYTELASIMRKTSGLVDVLADALSPLAADIDAAFVFGSMASGRAGADSDIDVLVIGSSRYADVVSALYAAQDALGREINPKCYTSVEWQELVGERGAFVQEVLGKPRLFVMGRESVLEGKDEPAQSGRHDT